MSAIATRTEADLQTDVQDELDWTPDVDSANIGVAVKDGTVSLSGEVDNYSTKLAARRAALRVRGVVTVVDEMTVRPVSGSPVTETEIAEEVQRALKWAIDVPDTVKAEITGHQVTLTGEVDWDFQRRAAKRAVQYLRGIYVVVNLITLRSRASAADTEARIASALKRNAQLDARAINVGVNGNKVVLTGTVRSWAEKRQAEFAAWASPHVNAVDNRIQVGTF